MAIIVTINNCLEKVTWTSKKLPSSRRQTTCEYDTHYINMLCHYTVCLRIRKCEVRKPGSLADEAYRYLSASAFSVATASLYYLDYICGH